MFKKIQVFSERMASLQGQGEKFTLLAALLHWNESVHLGIWSGCFHGASHWGGFPNVPLGGGLEPNLGCVCVCVNHAVEENEWEEHNPDKGQTF